MTLSGHWTSWSEKDYWDSEIAPRFHVCNARNIREVCLGYPLFDLSERYEICEHRRFYGVCDEWPVENFTRPDDQLRCRMGYEGPLCGKCAVNEVKRCVPKDSDPVDGYFSYKKYEFDKAKASYLSLNYTDCYAIGDCDDPNLSGEECQAREDLCWSKPECRWDAARYANHQRERSILPNPSISLGFRV